MHVDSMPNEGLPSRQSVTGAYLWDKAGRRAVCQPEGRDLEAPETTCARVRSRVQPACPALLSIKSGVLALGKEEGRLVFGEETMAAGPAPLSTNKRE